MLSKDVSKPTFNAISHENHAQTVNRKPSSLHILHLTSLFLSLYGCTALWTLADF
jgi:hypothetical protein